MPGPGEKVVFNETNKCIKHPFVIYADFESILEKTDDIKKNISKAYPLQVLS